VLATGADLLVTANPGCLMQVATSIHRIAPDRAMRAVHTVEVLDASLRGLPQEGLGNLSTNGRRRT